LGPGKDFQYFIETKLLGLFPIRFKTGPINN
jgi:hypothetical protein